MNPVSRLIADIIDPPEWWFYFFDILCLVLGAVGGVATYEQGGAAFWASVLSAVFAAIFLLTGSSQRLYRWLLGRTRLLALAFSLRGSVNWCEMD